MAATAAGCMLRPQALSTSLDCCCGSSSSSSGSSFGFGKHGGKLILRKKSPVLVRSSLLADIAAQVSPERRMYVGIAAVVVPVLMAAGAYGGGLILKRNIRIQGARDAEELMKLVEDGMEFEEAKAIIFRKIEEEYNGAPKVRRKRSQKVEETPAVDQTQTQQQQHPTVEEN